MTPAISQYNNKSSDANSSSPFCFLPYYDVEVCIPFEVSVLLHLVLIGLYFYQILFVWMLRYHYQYKHEKRLWIMTMCILSCLLDIFAVLLPINLPTKMLADVLQSYMHFQIFSITMLFYFFRILNVLTKIQRNWKRTLLTFYMATSFALMLIAIYFAAYYDIEGQGINICKSSNFLTF